MTARLARGAAWAGGSVAATVLGGPAAGIAVVVLCCGHGALRRWVVHRYEAELRGAAEDVLAAVATELDAGASPDGALRTALASVTSLPAHPHSGEAHSGADRLGGGRQSRRSDSRRGGGRSGRAAGSLDLPRLRELLADADADDAPRLLSRCDAGALRQLATAFRVCRLTGVRLAPVAVMLADAARSDAARADELAAALAGPRSSGRLVAGLPLLGVAMGILLGASPVDVLTTSPVGTICLAAGVLLDLAGLRWLRRISDGVQARVPPVCAGPIPPGRPGDAAASGEYRRRMLADLPLALDLVSACLRAGATTQHALEVVGSATGGPAGVELRATGRSMRHGAPADEACRRLLGAVGVLSADSAPRRGWRAGSRRSRRRGGTARLSRALGIGALPGRAGSARQREAQTVLAAVAAIGRTESSGARLATTLTRISTRARQETHAAAIGAARRAGVLAVAPLGLCFLPAFLLLGVVPIIIGTAPDLGSGLLPQP
ncbi:secretion system protein [Frankia sp. R43]|uniref:hypothetical protein n=1 Tax=Frankia sp. R43 TaxID=269536 RepID=UPI0006CA3AF5|nr:hypothetical protein [Frankia sp. R43]KPM53068.1 secretion system protein [Frankia sp. R43]